MIARFYRHQQIKKYLSQGKAVLILGPRRVGKTTLLQSFLTQFNQPYRLITGDNLKIQADLSTRDFKIIKEYLEGIELLAIDEAQKIPFIGEVIKIIVDYFPPIKVIATGSSSFELAGQLGEPLTGRKITLKLFPLALLELQSKQDNYQLNQQLADYLVYGLYPEVVTAEELVLKKRLLIEVVESYLLKDILSFERLKGAKILFDLLKLLAFQIGQEVSLPELGRQLGLDYKTVARYLDLFEKSFIIFNIRGFSRNLRKEISKKSKYYFYDLGVRNALIGNFNRPADRNDLGQLWENFIIIERIKKQAYHQIYSNNYFWRTWDGQEIDWVEEREGKLFGYEIKWSPRKKIKPPKDWLKTYPNASWQLITQENFLEFIV